MAVCGKHKSLCLFMKHKRILSSIIIRSVRGSVPVPDFDLSLEEKLKEMNAKDPVIHAKVDIGFSLPKLPRSEMMKQKLLIKEHMLAREKLSLAARTRTLKISLDEVKKEWKRHEGSKHIKNIAEHYGIYKDLFEYGYFMPYVIMDIAFDYDNDHETPVYYGNIINPSEALKAPSVLFESNPNDLWTITLTNLDGHLTDNNSEYLHWFIGNIKGNDISSGEIICDYLQPFPPHGSGYHRFVFILYKQEANIDYSKLKRKLPCYSLQERTFLTLDFYKEYQDVLTPAGLSFFQSVYDDSLTDFFHHTLKMREPVFEYAHKPVYFKRQKYYPHKEPFNLYLDRYRDPKEIRKEVILKRLKTITPFEEEPPPPKYPNIYKNPPNTPSWRRAEIWKERNRLGKYRDLRPYSSYPEPEEAFYDIFKTSPVSRKS